MNKNDGRNGIQKLDSILPNLEKLFSRKNRSLSGVYKAVRKQRRISHIGDYPLMAYILKVGYERGYQWRRRQAVYALRFTDMRGTILPKEWRKYFLDAVKPKMTSDVIDMMNSSSYILAKNGGVSMFFNG